MTREEFKIILNAAYSSAELLEKIYFMIGGDYPQVFLSSDGVLTKLNSLKKLVEDNSIYANDRSDEGYAEFRRIIDSKEISLEEKVFNHGAVRYQQELNSTSIKTS